MSRVTRVVYRANERTVALNLRDYCRPWRIIQQSNNSREINRLSNLSSAIKVNRRNLKGVIRVLGEISRAR